MVVLRSLLFALLQAVITPVFCCIVLFTFPFNQFFRFRVISSWSRLFITLSRVICGIRYRVKGIENIPDEPCIVMSKHQSAWETLAFQVIFPPQVQVIKKELLRIPFFGWGLALLSPIAIDRGAGSRALRQIEEQGIKSLKRGFWVIVFPEGTRMEPGARGKYLPGGAWLAARSGALVLPVALNSGEMWARNAFLKYPGTITVSIGKPIDPAGMKADEINSRVESWIEQEMAHLRSP
ncbi:MAG TPA: lysophospholipid acyltransferase family protein [Burkholderiales bacterium]|nr:lysophospholipid acyltransferase family protein [Burkholderiales bacterium]